MVTKNTDFWLNEAELKTPIHDAMVLWTFKNSAKIIQDLKIEPKIRSHYKMESTDIKSEKIIEYPIKGYNGFNLGFIDLVFQIQGNRNVIFDCVTEDIISYGCRDGSLVHIGFEIKPEVKSIGDVLRQFQYYKSNHKFHGLILVTKTTGLKEIFESQGFYVVEYSEEVKEDGNRK